MAERNGGTQAMREMARADEGRTATLASIAEAREATRRFGVSVVQFDNGQWRPVLRTSADRQHRLATIQKDMADERRRRLAALAAEVARPPAAPSSVGWRHDPQGRLRLNCWESGPVVGPAVVPTVRFGR
jgi:hypothetical protein